MLNFRAHTILPSIPAGYELDSRFSIVVPVQRTNEITNPSAELGTTTGYTAGSGSLSASTEQQYHGTYSFKYVPGAGVNDGFYYTLSTTIALRAISCKFKGQAGVPYAFTIASTVPADLATKVFIATGRWQWIYLYFNETSATTRRIYFRKNGSTDVQPFYIDGVQSEVLASALETVSTYIDGDQPGLLSNQFPPAYYWTGTPHASTSVRSGLTRAGGMIVPFKMYGFILTAIIGLGLAAPQNTGLEYARIDGGYDDYTRKPTRQFTLTGRLDAPEPQQLRDRRGALGSALDRDLVAQDQRLLLLHERVDTCDEIDSTTARIYAKYQNGLNGNTNNLYAEDVPLTFVQYMPTILADGEAGAALLPQVSVSNANGVLYQSPAGVWSAIGTGANGTVRSVLLSRTGLIYIGGDFTSFNGVANTSHIAVYNPATGTVSALGTGASGGNVFSLVEATNGDIYAGGSFTSMGGVGNTAKIARWDIAGGTWNSLGSSAANGDVNGLLVGLDGKVYAIGNYVSIGGTAANFVAYYDGSWHAMGTGLNSTGNSLAVGPTGLIYAVGGFTTAGGVSAAKVAVWDPSALSWAAMGSGLTGGSSAYAIVVAPSGAIFAGGDFTGFLKAWNGVTWQTLGSGLTGTQVRALTVLADGSIIIGGSFQVTNVPTNDSIARFIGNATSGTFTPVGIDLPGSAVIYTLVQDSGGGLYVGFDTSGTATAPGVTTITNIGDARSYPTIIIRGPSSGTARLYTIANPTTNRTINFNYTMVAGERVIMNFQPDNLSFESNIQGDVSGKILPGSNTADFFLTPGNNVITVLAASSTIVPTISWRPAYTSIDKVPSY